MSEWEPEEYVDDPVANAILNVAKELSALAKATNGLLYGLKYSKDNGLSIAEAIEVGAQSIASAVSEHASEVQQAAFQAGDLDELSKQVLGCGQEIGNCTSMLTQSLGSVAKALRER